MGSATSGANSEFRPAVSDAWMRLALSFLEKGIRELGQELSIARDTLAKAEALLRAQLQNGSENPATNGKGRLLAWQARKVSEYIDKHIAGTVRVADLCELIQRSEAHFSRSFKRTFGESPHAFVIRRRLELASQCMLSTDASLSDIAVRCGFTDQAHLSKLFRQFAGKPPASWRRTRRISTDFSEREKDSLIADRTPAISARGVDAPLAVQVGS